MINYVNDKGLATAAAEIKSRIGSGSASAGGLHIGKYVDEQVSGCVSVSTLPYTFSRGSAVTLNNEIHILGSDNSSYYTNHYKFNGSSWENVSTLPYSFYGGNAVVYNDEIHILGSNYFKTGNYPYATHHYKFNGSSWENVSTLPYDFHKGSAVVYNNEIHILGGDNSNYRTSHYKFNGSSWENVSTLPYDFYMGSTVVYNDEIHILSGNNSSYYTSHYKYAGNSWVNVSTLPGKTSFGVVLNNEVHGAYDLSHYIVRPDNRHIVTLLPAGAHILLPQNETTIFATDNANIEAPNLIKMTESGIVEILAELPDLDDVKSYLTFY